MDFDFKEYIIKMVKEIPTLEGTDLSFFLDPTVFPVGSDLGQDRELWNFGFSWLNGLTKTAEKLEVLSFEYSYQASFKGVFHLEDKSVQLLGDFDPPRPLDKEELEFIKSNLPNACRLFIVGVYRPSTTRTQNGLPLIRVDAAVAYWATGNRRGPTPLQLLTQKNSTHSVPER